MAISFALDTDFNVGVALHPNEKVLTWEMERDIGIVNHQYTSGYWQRGDQATDWGEGHRVKR